MVSVSAALCVAAILLVSGNIPLKAAKGDNDYDNLIKNSSEWSAKKTLAEADRQSHLGDKGKALVLYMSVVEQLATDNSPKASEMRVRACISQGDIYKAGGNYGEALRSYMKGLEISESSDREPHIALIYKDMAGIYNLFRDYDKKISLEKSGLAKAREQHDTAMMAQLLNNLTLSHVATRNPREARRYYEMYAAVNNKSTPEDRFYRDYNLAMVVRQEGNLKEALGRFRDLARRADKDIADPRYKCSVYNEIYWIYQDLKEAPDSAEYYLNECIRMVKENKLSLMFMDEIKELSEFYRRRGDKARAMKWKLEYLELADSAYINNVRKLDGASNRQFLYEMDKAEGRINELWQEKRHHRGVITRQRWIIFGTLLGVIISAFIIRYIFRQNRRLTESYRSLYSLNKTLAGNHREAVAVRRTLEDENERLRGLLAAAAAAPEGEDNSLQPDHGEPGKGKYSSSNLDDEQERLLARRIIEAMESNGCFYCDPEFSLRVLADKIGSNVKYVSQVINNAFGKSFTNYVNEYRIREACERLSGRGPYSNYSIKGIGESVGFKSHSTFVGVFKKITGMTPSVYRKMAIS